MATRRSIRRQRISANSPQKLERYLKIFSAVILLILFAQFSALAQETVSLEQAQSRAGRDFVPAYEGKTIRVHGQVTSSSIWALGTYYLPIRDNADRSLILAGDTKLFADLGPGDWIDAEGKVENRGGLPLLLPTSIKKTSQEAAPPPKDLPLSQLADVRNLGVMVRTTGVVKGIGENTGGKVLVISDRGYSLNAFLPRAVTEQSENLTSGLLKAREGDRVQVVGLATQYSPAPPYNRGFQIMMVSADDVDILESASTLPPLTWLGLAGALILLFGLWWFRERRIKRQRESWQAFYRLSEDLIAATTPGEMAEKLSSVLPSVIEATSANLYLFDRRTQCLHRIPTDAEPEPMAIPFDDPPEGMAGAAVTSFRNRALLSIPDTRRNPLVKVGAKMNLPRSAMFVPLMSQQEILGVLEAGNMRAVGYFSPDEQASTQHLANQAAASLKLQEQRAMREQIFRSEKLAATGQLISGVASELREPLDSIATLAESLSGLEDRPLSASDLRDLYAESRRAAEIVARLVSFAASNETAESIDLNTVFTGLIKFREPEWKGLGLRIQTRLSPAPAMVVGSRGQLEQLFLNLLIHAEQSAAAAAPKSLTHQSSIIGGQVHVEIAYSVTQEEPAKEGSSLESLGLGVCLGIARTHGGGIEFHSRSGTARFDVHLPIAATREQSPPDTAEVSKPSRPLTLMLVDPEPSSQRTLLRMVGNRGHRAVPVNAQEATELLGRLRFDAVFWAMRSGNGSWRESYERIRPQVPSFILLSDSYDAELARTLESTGAFLVPRPVQEAELERVLREVQLRNPGQRG